MGVVTSIIKKQPLFIKKLYYNFVPFENRYGEEFKNTFNFIMQSKDWDLNKLKEFQFQELKKILIHSRDNVPYYRDLFNSHGIKVENFQNFDDIKIIPLLTKEIINQNFDKLLAENYKNKKLFKIKTSGSTGKKLEFYATDSVYKKEAAFILRAYKEHGATLYDKPSIWLRRYVPSNEQQDLWNYDYELKRLYMSAYHLNKSTIKQYLEEIQKKKYHTLVGYPSSVYSLACLLEEENLSIEISAIHVASEMMLPQWKEKIEKIFGIPVKAHYGQMEKVSLFQQDLKNDFYSDCLEYSYTEFIKDDEQNIVVGTGFINYAMPFIRYRTNDTAELNNEPTSVGLPKTVKYFNGRCDDILIAKNGTRLPGVNFYTMMYKIDGVKMFQINQKSLDMVNFKLVKSDKFTTDTLKQIEDGLKKRIGDVKINFDIVENIERNKTSGKIRCIFNEIKS
jgi:phenylacetate-CoA ligase